MDFQRDSEFAADLSPLAWVQEELRRSLEASRKALRRYLRDAQAMATLGRPGQDRPDTLGLTTAQQQLHLAAGVLSLVQQSAGATLLRASEAAMKALIAQPERVNQEAVDVLERADFALLDFIARQLVGRPVSSLHLFPHYLAVQTLAGGERAHPADLWEHQWTWTDLSSRGAPPRNPQTAHARFERSLLNLMRNASADEAKVLSDLCASLGAGEAQKPVHAPWPLWQLAAAFFEAQARGLLLPDSYVKRIGSRLLAQLRAGPDADPGVAEHLARDLLFFCAQSARPPEPESSPRLSAVREAYGLTKAEAVDYEEMRLGLVDPAWVTHAHKRVSVAKDAWSAVADGDLKRLVGLDELFALVSESLQLLFPNGAELGESLQRAVVGIARAEVAPTPALAMEVATSMLYLDAALEDASFDAPELPERVRRLAQRVEAVAHGDPAQPLDGWMEDLYRRVSDRQTMGSVVQELRGALSETEKLVDEYFRDTSKREVLIPVPGQLAAMRGVLTVLGMQQAAQAVQRMRSEVDELVSTEVDPSRHGPLRIFERLAANLGALGFLIDMLSVQPQLAKRLFLFDEGSGLLSPVMGRQVADTSGFVGLDDMLPAEPDLHEQDSESEHIDLSELIEPETQQVELEPVPEPAEQGIESQHMLADQTLGFLIDLPLAEAHAEPVESSEPTQPAAEQTASPVEATTQAQAEVDPEMLAVFLEECQEVIATARDAIKQLRADEVEQTALTTVRRSFHTLKGSSRMVGLQDFGEAAWACEQLYNARLGKQQSADAHLLDFSDEALDYFADWSEAISQGRDGGHQAASLRRAADALRLESRVEAIEWPQNMVATPSEVNELSDVETPFVLESEFGLDAEPKEQQQVEAVSEPVSEPGLESWAESIESPSFELELDLDKVPAPIDLSVAGSDLAPLVLEGEAPVVTDAMQAPGEPTSDEIEPEAESVESPAVKTSSHLELAYSADAMAASAQREQELAEESEAVKVIGPLRISISLFNIFLNEADELSRRLCIELAEWNLELNQPVPESSIALAHSLAGNAATVGFDDLSQLARLLEHALERTHALRRGTPEEGRLYVDAADEIRRLLHQFAAGFLKQPDVELNQRLVEHERDAAERLQDQTLNGTEPGESGAMPLAEMMAKHFEAPPAHLAQGDAEPEPRGHEQDLGQVLSEPLLPAHEEAVPSVWGHSHAHDELDLSDLDAQDAIEAELFPFFEEEGKELLQQLAQSMRDWHVEPADLSAASACMRDLHTLKGGARLCGAMRLGEMAHRMESVIQSLLAEGQAAQRDVDRLQNHLDVMAAEFEALRQPAPQEIPTEAPAAPTLAAVPAAEAEPEVPVQTAAAPAMPAHADLAVTPVFAPAPVDWSRFKPSGVVDDTLHASDERPVGAPAHGQVRVRAPLLERLINEAGEVSIRRSRMESEVSQMRGSMADLSENLDRLRQQLRDMEFQANAQIGSRMESAKETNQEFDPLEFDRYTRMQELTHIMAESVGDLATVQRSLQRALQSTEDELAAQARLTRDLQDDLLSTRMVEFDSLSDRLYRVLRLTAKETGKQVKLDVQGGSIEVDRGVLERMTAAFEHLLRNSVTHGIEMPAERLAQGKDASGTITVTVTHEDNEVVVEFRDDGAGLDLERIRQRGLAMGLLTPEDQATQAELIQLIFMPGFSTASTLTELAGRGVGMDVVRNDVNAIGGRIVSASTPGLGTSFKLRLPLTTAVTQVVMLRCADNVVAAPATLIENIKRATASELEAAYRTGVFTDADEAIPFFWLGGLLQQGMQTEQGVLQRSQSLVIVKSAQQRVALHVDEVIGKQEVVVKNLGPQLVRVPGLAGITLLASGQAALIYNPVALATLYGDHARKQAEQALSISSPLEQQAAGEQSALVMVVDDSLTVRRVTQRLLEREGYRVMLAKDGMDALERLAEELPALVLSDIEMPRMDGFDLVRNMQADERLRQLPVIMITSRIAQKHRDYAAELGVRNYLGKPYDEDELLALIARYTSKNQ